MTDAFPAAPRFRLLGLLEWLDKLSFMAQSTLFLLRRRRSVDVLHVHESHWLAGFAAWLGHHLGLPVVCKEATFPVLPAVGSHVPGRRRWAAWRLRAHFIAQTPDAARALQAAGVPVERIRIIPNGVDVPPQAADVKSNQDVLYVGNLSQKSEWKAFDVLFEAWPQVSAAGIQARLIVVGAGQPDDGMPGLKTARAEKSVVFTGPVDDPRPYYQQAAVFVLPSRREGMSNALLEAQSWGVPAVVSDIPGNTAVVLHEETGLVVPVDQPSLLAESLLRLLRDAPLRQRLGNNARQRIRQHFALTDVVDQVLLLYQHIAHE